MPAHGSPQGGASRTVDIAGPVHVVDYGGDGPPLVLVHGLGGSHLNWMLVAPLLARSFRVLAVDLPGFGLTGLEGRSADVRTQAGVIAELVRTDLGQPVTVVGNSMGGLIALLCAAHHPDVVSRLVLVDPALLPTAPTVPSADTMRYLGMPLLPVVGGHWTNHLRKLRSPEEQVDATFDYVAADPSRIPDEVRIAGVVMEEARRRMPWSTKAFSQAGRSIASVLLRRDRFVRLIHSIGVPALLIHGDEDDVVPLDSAHWLQRHRPDWEIVTFHGVGHVAQLEVPEKFVSTVTNWLERTPEVRPVVAGT